MEVSLLLMVVTWRRIGHIYLESRSNVRTAVNPPHFFF